MLTFAQRLRWRLGAARRGAAWLGLAGRGRSGRGKAWSGWAWLGLARQGEGRRSRRAILVLRAAADSQRAPPLKSKARSAQIPQSEAEAILRASRELLDRGPLRLSA
jgi:hypothetical protein